MTFAEQLKKAHDSLSPAERRVSRVLMADYPAAGLEPVHRLAARANVSAPTVLRLITKLGTGSYPQFQNLLRGEISASRTSPLEMYGDRASKESRWPDSAVAFVSESRKVLIGGMAATFDSIPEGEITTVTRLLANPRKNIWTVGGRFSDLLARYLHMHLKLMRPNSYHVGESQHDKTFALIDFGPHDVLVAFDYRRYQQDTVQFLLEAKKKKVTTVLFTDPWLSPAAKHADFSLSSSVRAASPFDSLTSSFALVETVVAGVLDELGEKPRQRMESFDASLEPTLHAHTLPLEPSLPGETTQEH